MRRTHVIVVVVALLAACESAPTDTTTANSATARLASSASAPPATSTAPTATAAASTLRAAPGTASAQAQASASATADPASPCAPGARKDDDARYCITLPEKKLEVSYEGDDPSKGIREELEVAGNRLVITIHAAPPGTTTAQLKADALERIGELLVDSGDLPPNGYWTELKEESGQHIFESVVVSKFIISCMHWVREEKDLEAARAVCKSLKTF